MSHREIARLLVKIAGVAMLAVALAQLPDGIKAFGAHINFLLIDGFEDWEALGIAASSSLLPSAILLLAGVGALWTSGYFMTAVTSDRIYFRRLEAMLIALIGVFFVADGLGDLIRWLAVAASSIVTYDRPLTDIFSHPNDFTLRGVAKLAVGFFLIIGRGGIIAARRRVDAWIRVWSCKPE